MSAPRRTVRLFVAVHLVAVLGIYAMALAIGGGLAPPPIPPDLHVAQPASPSASTWPGMPAAPHGTASARGSDVEEPLPGGALPVWAQRSEAPAPWEGR